MAPRLDPPFLRQARGGGAHQPLVQPKRNGKPNQPAQRDRTPAGHEGIAEDRDDEGTGALRAYDAENLSNELWTSNLDQARDALPGGSVKFSVATPVNGRVYAVSNNDLVVYGPPQPPTAPPAAPTSATAIATGASTISVNWTDNSTNEAGFAIERSPADKDASDTELALLAAAARGATDLVVLGAFGGRLDHALREAARRFGVVSTG